jgi:hypothetical protein
MNPCKGKKNSDPNGNMPAKMLHDIPVGCFGSLGSLTPLDIVGQFPGSKKVPTAAEVVMGSRYALQLQPLGFSTYR